MSDWAIIHLPTLIVAAFIAVAVVAVVIQLTLDRIRRLQDEVTIAHTLLDQHRIPYPKPKE